MTKPPIQNAWKNSTSKLLLMKMKGFLVKRKKKLSPRGKTLSYYELGWGVGSRESRKILKFGILGIPNNPEIRESRIPNPEKFNPEVIGNPESLKS